MLDDETWYVSICIYEDFLLINIILIKVKECNFFLPFLVNGLRSEVTVDVSPRLPGRDCTLSDTAYGIVTTWVDVTGLSSIQQWVRWSTGIIPVRVKPFGLKFGFELKVIFDIIVFNLNGMVDRLVSVDLCYTSEPALHGSLWNYRIFSTLICVYYIYTHLNLTLESLYLLLKTVSKSI